MRLKATDVPEKGSFGMSLKFEIEAFVKVGRGSPPSMGIEPEDKEGQQYLGSIPLESSTLPCPLVAKIEPATP